MAAIAGAWGVALFGARAPNGVPRVVGHVALVALSGSMAPVFRAGDLIVDRVVTPREADDLRAGQIITYRLAGNGELVTHRIVDVLSGPGGPRYRTQGDANNTPDPVPVIPAQVVGLYGWRIPCAGRVIAWIRRPLGVVLVLALPAATLAGTEVWRATGGWPRPSRL
jgi:signal peptidase